MAVTFNTTYPAALTNAAWQKKKSFLDKAKSKTKTGLGDELLKAEAAWKLVKFDLLDAKGKVCPRPVDWDNAKHAAEAHYKDKAAAASKAALAAAAKAAATKQNKALSSTAKAAAQTIETGLLAQAAHIRDIKFDDFDTAKEKLEELTAAVHLKALKDTLARGNQFIAAVGKPPKATVFNQGAHKASRDITQALGNIGAVGARPDPKKLGDPLLQWANANTVAVDDSQVAAALDTYKKAVKAVENWGGALLQ